VRPSSSTEVQVPKGRHNSRGIGGNDAKGSERRLYATWSALSGGYDKIQPRIQ
jgi:hypothetical protein